MDNKQKAFQQKVKNRKFAVDHSWRGSVHAQEAAAAEEQNGPVAQDRHVWNALEENLYSADLHKVNTAYFPIHSRIRYLGKLIVFIKKVIRKLFKILLGWYIFPILHHQNVFNGKLLNAVALERDLLTRMENRITELENANQQLRAELASAKSEASEQLAAEIKFREVAFGVIGDSVSTLNTKLLQESDAWKMGRAAQDKTIADLDASLLTCQTRQEAQKEAIENLDAKLVKIENLPTSDDEFYHHFEEKFRGSREEIINRLQVYVPYVKERLPDWSQARFIDIGSGRGEWLDILQYYGATDYVGVDLNVKQNTITESFGHKTVCCDCIEYLAEQPDNSVDLITGIQIIEHLCMSDLMELLKQSHRVLKKNGMILFETQNPRNITVGADTFYIDPSHKRPLEPRMMEFMAEWTGFKDIKCIDANANPLWEGIPLPEANARDFELVKQFNDIKWLLYGPMDYALFAVKE